MKKLETRKGLRKFWINIGRAVAIKKILTLIDKMPCTICRKVCFGNLETIYKTDLKEKIKEME